MDLSPIPIDLYKADFFRFESECGETDDHYIPSESSLASRGKIFCSHRSHMVRHLIESKTTRSTLAGIAGFIVYGGWAFYVNSQHGSVPGLKAGLVQGSYSFVLTMGITLLMETLWAILQNSKGGTLLTIVACNTITVLVAYLINWSFGTPEILLTIIPGFLIGFCYTAFYVLSLSRLTGSNQAELK